MSMVEEPNKQSHGRYMRTRWGISVTPTVYIQEIQSLESEAELKQSKSTEPTQSDDMQQTKNLN